MSLNYPQYPSNPELCAVSMHPKNAACISRSKSATFAQTCLSQYLCIFQPEVIHLLFLCSSVSVGPTTSHNITVFKNSNIIMAVIPISLSVLPAVPVSYHPCKCGCRTAVSTQSTAIHNSIIYCYYYCLLPNS